ncbi:MAG: exodeoxyribonuclease VII small subunit [Saprospiraceae bacterium]|nr:exodeoxyribonuclease VII small subunit [Saprospiraceae bacterium]
MKKDHHKPASYEDAWSELQQIVAELQAETVSVDALAEKIERANQLATFCREKLRQTEKQLEELNHSA